MANVLVEETSLQNIANSIREKNGTTDTYKPSEMAGAISGISTGGGSVPEKGIVINEWDSNGYPTEISVVGITYIPQYYFLNCWSQHSGSAKYSLLGKAKLNLPDDLTGVNDGGFYECRTLELSELPDTVTTLGIDAFYNCLKISFTKLPDNIKLGNACFYGCTNLALTELPSNLNMTSVPNKCFYGCTNLALTELPSKITSIGQSAFENTSLITKLTIQGALTFINSSAFYNSKLTELIMPNVTKVPTMLNSALESTPIAYRTGYIYVPNTLVDSFKSATNWSAYADQIKPISELPTE